MTDRLPEFAPRCMQLLLFIAIVAAVAAIKGQHPAWYTATMYVLLFLCVCLFVACDPDPPTQEDIDGYLGINS